jgi:putative salt-induced outer membrane protein
MIVARAALECEGRRMRGTRSACGVAIRGAFHYSLPPISSRLAGMCRGIDNLHQSNEGLTPARSAECRKSVFMRSCIGALLLGPLAAHAEEIPQGWSGKGQAGYVMSRGNSDTDSANVKIDLNLLRNAWKHSLSLDGLFGRSAGITSAERWDARLQSDYQINAHLFSFAALSYQDDRFSGFQYQASGSAGFGYKFFDSDNTRLSAQVGVGYRSLRPELLIKDESGAVIDRIAQETQTEVVATAGVDFSHRFNANTRLLDKLVSESGSSNVSIRNDLALEVKMNRKLSLAAGFSVLENTKPPAGLKRTDTITTLNLVYAFPGPH